MRRWGLELTRGGVAVECAVPRVRLEPAAAISLQCRITTPTVLQPGDGVAWALTFWYEDSAANPVSVHLAADMVLVAAGSVERKGAEQGTLERSQAVTLIGKYSAFADLGPTENFSVLETDSHRELDRIFTALGLERPDVDAIPPVDIDRIEYRREVPWMASLAAYLAPFEPLIFADPLDERFRFISGLDCAPGESGVGGTITMDDVRGLPGFDGVKTLGPADRCDQCVVTYTRSYRTHGTGTGALPGGTYTESETVEGGDGGHATIEKTFQRFQEDPADPDAETREPVEIAQTVTHVRADGQITLRLTSETEFEDDWTRPKRETETREELIEEPVLGEVLDVTDEVVATYRWERDPDNPRVYHMKRSEVARSGFYYHTGATPEDDPAAVAAHEASWNRAVDTSVTSIQRGARGPIETTTTNYTRQQGTFKWLRWTIDHLKADAVRDIDFGTETGDNGLTVQSETRRVYVPSTITGTPRAAVGVDATAIGLEHGRWIAARKVAQGAVAKRTCRVPLRLVDPWRWRLGWHVQLSGMPEDFDGEYLIDAVEFDLPERDEAAPLQTLSLYRRW